MCFDFDPLIPNRINYVFFYTSGRITRMQPKAHCGLSKRSNNIGFTPDLKIVGAVVVRNKAFPVLDLDNSRSKTPANKHLFGTIIFTKKGPLRPIPSTICSLMPSCHQAIGLCTN
jgi:hypothetical protein